MRNETDTDEPTAWTTNGIALALLVGLPLVGVGLTGRPLRTYMEFPPLTRHVRHAEFSWGVFTALAILTVAVIAPFVLRVAAHGGPTGAKEPSQRRTFPWWGWAGLALSVVTWGLAWTRMPWFAGGQLFTFSPLWLGYILVVNGLAYRRIGRCMLTHRTRYFLLLFPVSAGFWWFFEYLNRFVQNWTYVGIDELTPFAYTVFASLPFATVLPAVLGTADLLETAPRWTAGLDRFASLDIGRPRAVAAIVLVLSSVGLAAIGVWPDYLFPLLWVSPLLIVTSLQALQGRATLFAPVQHGDWRRLVVLATAALICGFFWEMWNMYSVAKWEYAVPFVHRFQVFEMPILGYAGYLPFGLECAVIAEMFLGRRQSVEHA